MSTINSLTFSKMIAAPEPQADGCGVDIVIRKMRSQTGSPQRWLQGTYQIPHTDALLIDTRPLQKALIITAIAGEQHLTRNLVGDMVLFEDDEIRIDAMYKGYFSFDLADWPRMATKREYFITISLGRYVSNTLHVLAI
ncbi:MAG: hypothetical protein HY080_00405 [Gammaproteobacteria bacterium]|nr:hypothetical protein [Gammaproteobacteria bacterium]